ncbi:hypothetical protein CaCOL14_003913 [Colletotrichum acutatum]
MIRSCLSTTRDLFSLSPASPAHPVVELQGAQESDRLLWVKQCGNVALSLYLYSRAGGYSIMPERSDTGYTRDLRLFPLLGSRPPSRVLGSRGETPIMTK